MELRETKGKKIFVGLSGGVDSAVSAVLLKRAGAQVTGVFIKGWYPPEMPCSWAAERRDAMRVAARLAIPFCTFDASAEYKKSVIDYLLAEYRAGRTPNPDVVCNRDIKFGAFGRYAREMGADAIATGHYRSGEKDQSYFLWAVPKGILKSAVFPVGHMKKQNVRTLAQHFHLPVAEKKDSQGVCFLGDVSVDEFLRREFGTVSGPAVTEAGELVGEHDGVLFYTIGERVPLEAGPWFVIAKDIEKNTLVVSRSHVPQHRPEYSIRFKQANWFMDPSRASEAQYRYRGKRIAGRVEGNRFIAAVPFPEYLALGQSIVFYHGENMVGGGIMAAWE